MTTTYYAKVRPCDCCGAPDEVLKIGRSAGGWKPVLFVHPFSNHDDAIYYAYYGPSIASLRDFLERDDVAIVDEFGGDHTADDFLDMVESMTTSSDGVPRREARSVAPDDEPYIFDLADQHVRSIIERLEGPDVDYAALPVADDIEPERTAEAISRRWTPETLRDY